MIAPPGLCQGGGGAGGARGGLNTPGEGGGGNALGIGGGGPVRRGALKPAKIVARWCFVFIYANTPIMCNAYRGLMVNACGFRSRGSGFMSYSVQSAALQNNFAAGPKTRNGSKSCTI